MKSIRVKWPAIRPCVHCGLDLQAVDEVDQRCRSGRGSPDRMQLLAIAIAICVFAVPVPPMHHGVYFAGDESRRTARSVPSLVCWWPSNWKVLEILGQRHLACELYLIEGLLLGSRV